MKDDIRLKVAAQAMAAILGNWKASVHICDTDPRYNGLNFSEVVAINAVEFADALIKQLEK